MREQQTGAKLQYEEWQIGAKLPYEGVADCHMRKQQAGAKTDAEWSNAY